MLCAKSFPSELRYQRRKLFTTVLTASWPGYAKWPPAFADMPPTVIDTIRERFGRASEASSPHFPESASYGHVAPRCLQSGKISSESAVTRAEPVFGFCALVLAVLQLGVRWR